MNRMLLVLLLFAGLAFAQNPNAAPYPPPGEMIDLGGYRVHINCTGSGSPAVMIAGGGFSFDWSLVQPEVARFTRVCTYDASGTAWSERGHGRGCPAWLNEVRELVERARVERPLVIVGFSAGAVIARLYATTYPGEVSGVVLVDHAFLPASGSNAQRDRPAAVEGAPDTPPALISMTPVIISS